MAVSERNGAHSQLPMDSVFNMQLVEPYNKRQPRYVPNHLLETKVYNRLGHNSCIAVDPGIIHIAGFQVGTTSTKRLRIVNKSSDPQNMHIIPPETQFFSIKYTKRSRMVSGSTLTVTLEFNAEEWRYYYDCIRIHCQDEDNIIVPIHAYPVMKSDTVPRILKMPAIPVGESITRYLPLQSLAPVEFSFEVKILKNNLMFTVDPMQGVIEPEGEERITVTFSPTDFCTATLDLQILVSQFEAPPLRCTVQGYSRPGLLKERRKTTFSMDVDVSSENVTVDPAILSTLQRSRNKKLVGVRKSNVTFKEESADLDVNGHKVPARPEVLNTPYGVSQVLLQKPGKLRAKDLKGMKAASKNRSESESDSYQMKSMMFENLIRTDNYEERQNQLIWQKKLGEDSMTEEQRDKVLVERSTGLIRYATQSGEPDVEVEEKRREELAVSRRSRRIDTEVINTTAKFDPYINDPWLVRWSTLEKLQRISRTVLIRARADKKIKGLQTLKLTYGPDAVGAASSEATDEQDQAGLKPDTAGSKLRTAPLAEWASNAVARLKQPTESQLDSKETSNEDTRPATYFTGELSYPDNVLYHELKVPLSSDLLGYSSLQAAPTYITVGPPRELRTGAEDEVIIVDAPDPDSVAPVDLAMPKNLLQPGGGKAPKIMQVGVQAFHAPLSLSETDPDYNFSPHHPLPSAGHMKWSQLHKTQVIRHVGTLPKAAGLPPSLSGVWVPSLTAGVLAGKPPALFLDPPAFQMSLVKENLEDIILSPAMVEAEFDLDELPMLTRASEKRASSGKVTVFPYGDSLPASYFPRSSTQQPIRREERAAELDFYVASRFNANAQSATRRSDILVSRFRENRGKTYTMERTYTTL